MFKMVIFWSLCQRIVRDVARPGISSVSLGFCGVTISLLMTKATPAELAGRSGSREFNICSLREKRVLICVSCSSVRCVSWTHRMPIFLSRIV
jgi:hypothetical protein